MSIIDCINMSNPTDTNTNELVKDLRDTYTENIRRQNSPLNVIAQSVQNLHPNLTVFGMGTTVATELLYKVTESLAKPWLSTQQNFIEKQLSKPETSELVGNMLRDHYVECLRAVKSAKDLGEFPLSAVLGNDTFGRLIISTKDFPQTLSHLSKMSFDQAVNLCQSTSAWVDYQVSEKIVEEGYKIILGNLDSGMFMARMAGTFLVLYSQVDKHLPEHPKSLKDHLLVSAAIFGAAQGALLANAFLTYYHLGGQFIETVSNHMPEALFATAITCTTRMLSDKFTPEHSKQIQFLVLATYLMAQIGVNSLSTMKLLSAFLY